MNLILATLAWFHHDLLGNHYYYPCILWSKVFLCFISVSCIFLTIYFCFCKLARHFYDLSYSHCCCCCCCCSSIRPSPWVEWVAKTYLLSTPWSGWPCPLSWPLSIHPFLFPIILDRLGASAYCSRRERALSYDVLIASYVKRIFRSYHCDKCFLSSFLFIAF